MFHQDGNRIVDEIILQNVEEYKCMVFWKKINQKMHSFGKPMLASNQILSDWQQCAEDSISPDYVSFFCFLLRRGQCYCKCFQTAVFAFRPSTQCLFTSNMEHLAKMGSNDSRLSLEHRDSAGLLYRCLEGAANLPGPYDQEICCQGLAKLAISDERCIFLQVLQCSTLPSY